LGQEQIADEPLQWPQVQAEVPVCEQVQLPLFESDE